MSPKPMQDLLVIIPGITGSVLSRNGEEIWGLSGEAIVGNLLSLGRNLKHLQLPDGIGDEDPNDGVQATRLMSDLHLLPGLWTIDGYSNLIKSLSSRFTLTNVTEERAGNLLLFPYDWRLSNVVSAKRLAQIASRELERWQKQSNNPEAKLILICHSMGGLVARWFLEQINGSREITRRLITIGTPYQGSINALGTLVNGFSKGLGPLRLNLTEMIRSFPSMYQLLPTYPSTDPGSGQLQKLSEVSVPNLESHRVRDALDFHQQISPSQEANEYLLNAIKGHIQPTAQSAMIKGDRIEPLREYEGKNFGGDGTVPRPSSHPPEWTDGDDRAVFAAQKHGSLQNSESVLDQLYGILTGHMGKWMGGDRIGLDIPDIVSEGDDITITAIAEGGDDTLALQAFIVDESGRQLAEPELLDNTGDGHYKIGIKVPAPGPYRIKIESAVPQRPVDPVTGITLVWGDAPTVE